MSESPNQREATTRNDKSKDRSFESNLIKTFEEICKHACEMIGVDHSGFVRFDHLHQRGEVVAQFPPKEGLIGRKFRLTGIPAEQRLLNADESIVIEDVRTADDLGEVKLLLEELNIRSTCIVRVWFHGIIIGSFSLDSIGETRRFTQEEVTLCKSFADLASKTIENAQLVDWLEGFEKAIAAITSERELAPLLKTIIQQAEFLFSAQSVGVYQRCLDDNGEDSLRLVASSDEDLIGRTLKKGEGMAWQLIRSNEPFMRASDYDLYDHRSTMYEGRFGSVLEVPLLHGEERIGIVYLSDVRGRSFTEFDARLLQRFADMATIALHQCNLFGRLKNLSIASTDISGHFESEDLETRLTNIAFHSTKILNAEMCGVFTADKAKGLILQASFGHAQGMFERSRAFQIRDEPGSGLTGAIAARLVKDYASYVARDQSTETLKRSMPVFNACGDSLTHDPAVADNPDATPTGKCHSLLAIPLVSKLPQGERFSGMLRISNKRGIDGAPHDPVCFTDEDEWFLRIFAEAVVVAIETAKLFDELKIQKDELIAQMELYGQLLDTWNTLASADPLENRLEKIAKNLLVILGKSFCRILLASESEEFLTVKAAAVHHRTPSNAQFVWSGGENSRSPISDWPHLKRALDEGLPYELQANGGLNPEDTLIRLSNLMGLRNENTDSVLQVQSIFSIPMRVGSHAIGLLSIGELRRIKDRRSISRGKDRRDIPTTGFTNNQKNLASAVAAQATVMIDRELRKQEVERREQLLSRLSGALGVIRDEPDSTKKLTVIAEQATRVFGCPIGGLFVQHSPADAIELLTNTEGQLGIVEDSVDFALKDLLSTEPLIDNEAVSSKFDELCSSLPLLTSYHLRTSLAVCFEYATRSRCLLFVGDDRPISELTAADLRVLEELGKHCSLSLTRASIREQLTRARDGVSQIAVDLALGDQEHALEHVVKGIRRATASDAVTLYPIRSIDNEIKAPPTTDGLRDPNKPLKYVKAVLDSPVGRVLRENKLYTTHDTSNDPVMAGGFVGREGIKSSAGTPIWLPTVVPENDDETDTAASEKVAVGVLFVNYRTPHYFVGEDERVIKMVANLAAVAIRNQELFNQQRRKATVLKSLYDASKAISGTFNLPEILNELAKNAFEIAENLDRRANHVAIKLFEDGKAKIHAVYPPSNEPALAVGKEIDLHPTDGKKRGIVGRAFEERESQLVGNVCLDSDYREVSPGTNSQIVALIRDESCPELPPVGAITIESPDLYAFNEDDFLAFKSLAVLAIDAIRSARQFAEREYALAREENLKDLALYYVKCGILIHNQKAHIEEIRKGAQMLQMFAKKYRTLPAEVQVTIGTVERNSQAIDEIRNLAELSDIEWTAIDVEEFVQTWKKRLTMRGDVGDLSIKVDSLGNAGKEVKVDLLLMRHLLKIFVDNAIIAMRPVFDKKLSITVRSVEQACKFVISDTGRGMNKERWNEISAGKSPRYGDPRPRKGLRTALLIATGFGGEIQLARTGNTGTTFEVTLRLASD